MEDRSWEEPGMTRCGEYVIEFRYAKEGKTMNECILDYISSLLDSPDQGMDEADTPLPGNSLTAKWRSGWEKE